MNSWTAGRWGVNSRAWAATAVKRFMLRVSFTVSNMKLSTMKLRCWISSAPAATNCCALMNAGTWPLTRSPRPWAVSAMSGTSAGGTEE